MVEKKEPLIKVELKQNTQALVRERISANNQDSCGHRLLLYSYDLVIISSSDFHEQMSSSDFHILLRAYKKRPE